MATLEDKLTGGTVKGAEHLRALCRETFGGGAGRQLLALINTSVPPMQSPINPSGENDPMAVGIKEGYRDFSALLWRYAAANLPLTPGSPGK